MPGGESGALVAASVGAWLGEQDEAARLIVVSHGFAGRVLRGLYVGASPAEIYGTSQPQDGFFRLFRGTVTTSEVRNLID